MGNSLSEESTIDFFQVSMLPVIFSLSVLPVLAKSTHYTIKVVAENVQKLPTSKYAHKDLHKIVIVKHTSEFSGKHVSSSHLE